MRLIHTADWHLGHTLAGHDREREHRRFLQFLVDTAEAERVDAVVVAGDVYDQGNPPAHAQRALFSVLAELRRRCPALHVIVIGGNHDAAARLDAPRPVLDALGVTVLGGMPRTADDDFDLDAALHPLTDAGGAIGAVCAAVPFLRAPDLSRAIAGGDLVIDGTRAVIERLVERARGRFPGVPVVLLGHCELQGARLSSSSERPLFGGRHALPLSLFQGADVAYAALGHLHLGQTVGSPRVRYSGSPLPLSMAERHYEHEIVLVDLDGDRVDARGRRVPRLVDFLRIPEEAAPLDEVLDRLRALDAPARPPEEQPFLEVRVRLDRPIADLRQRVEQALEGRSVRLVRIERDAGASEGLGLGDITAAAGVDRWGLSDLSPHAVFGALYARTYSVDPPAELSRALRTLVDDLGQDEGA